MALSINDLKARYFGKDAESLDAAGLSLPTLQPLLADYFANAALPLTGLSATGALTLHGNTELPGPDGTPAAALAAQVVFMLDVGGTELAGLDVRIGPAFALNAQHWAFPGSAIAELTGATLYLRLRIAVADAAASAQVELALPLPSAPQPISLFMDAASLGTGDPGVDINSAALLFSGGDVNATLLTLSGDLHELLYFNPQANLLALIPKATPVSSKPVLARIAIPLEATSRMPIAVLAEVRLVDPFSAGPLQVEGVAAIFSIMLPSMAFDYPVRLQLGASCTYRTFTSRLMIVPAPPEQGGWGTMSPGAFELTIDDEVGVGDTMSGADAGQGHQMASASAGQLVISGQLPAPGDKGPMAFALSLVVTEPVEIFHGISLDSAMVQIQIGQVKSVVLGAMCTFGPVTLTVDATYDDARGWDFRAELFLGSGAPGRPPGMPGDGNPTPAAPPLLLGSILADLANRVGVPMPWLQSAIPLDDFRFECQDGDLIRFSIGGPLSIGSKAARLQATLDTTLSTHAVGVGGAITVDDFKLTIDKSADDSIEVSLGDGSGLTLATIAGWFGIALSANLGPAITTLRVRHDLNAGGWGIYAATPHLEAQIAVDAEGDYFVSLVAHLNLTFGQSGLSLPDLAAASNFGLPNVQLIVASQDVDADRFAALQKLLPSQVVLAIPVPTPQGRTLYAPLDLGGLTQQQSMPVGHPGALQILAAADASPPTVYWVRIDRSVGPVQIARVGIGFTDGTVTLGIEGALNLDAITLSFEGLLLSASFSSGFVGASLNGLALAMDTGALSVSGELVMQNSPGFDGGSAYAGSALIEAPQLSLAAMGGWGSVQGAPSLFVFGQLDEPLGGPAFFFVKGVSATFGLNRNIVVPPVAQLPDFPLIKAAMADATHPNPLAGQDSKPGAVLGLLGTSIVPEYGARFAGAGVRFTSFGVIEGFALVLVQFGARVKFSLLGMATTALPKGATKPIFYAELPLEVIVDPGAGSVSAMARLSSKSYVLNPSCVLQGGFAFGIWARDDSTSGATAGDFVYTVGGYHPSFAAPTYYPAVPRVSGSWKDGGITIEGSFYFAITPAALMAGGAVQAVWQDGGLRAWFGVDADFLIAWRPFSYIGHVGVDLGASFTIDLAFTSIDVTIHLGVDVDLFGPPFHGTAKVDLSIISFTVNFGDWSDASDPPTIKWSEFTTAFFPTPPASSVGAHVLADTGETTNLALCSARVTKGLRKTPAKDATKPYADTPLPPDWIIDGARFEISTRGAVPFTAAYVVRGEDGVGKPVAVTGSWAVDTFGVGPVGVANGKLLSEHTISLRNLDDPQRDPAATLAFIPVLGAVPATMWSTKFAMGPTTDTLNDNKPVIGNLLLGFTIRPSGDPAAAGLPEPILLERLEFENDPHLLHWQWQAPVLPLPAPHPQDQAVQRLQSTIADGDFATRRAALIAAAAAAGLSVTGDVSLLLASTIFVNTAPPLLRSLGET